ncbi:hypothetical protein [Treponema pectinovorum]|uniref:hypothetical protein n=1 Tax=Treponema pectinovorum TaxID=164 RepID=UPI0011F0EF99|nr:hypothetical protein [Treponema pectinovorum]
MKEFNEMTVTIKLKPYEFQSLCEIVNKSEKTDRRNEDTLELNLIEKHFVSSIFKRLASSGRRKADKLESIGNEVRNCIDFANCK